MRFAVRSDPGQHVRGLHWKFSHGRFTGQHHTIRPVQDGVGHIRGFGPGGAAVLGHGFQHLGGGDHRFGLHIGLVHDSFLNDSHLFDGNFNAQIPPGNHDTISHLEDGLKIIQRPRALYLGNDKGIVPHPGSRCPHSFDIGSRIDE